MRPRNTALLVIAGVAITAAILSTHPPDRLSNLRRFVVKEDTPRFGTSRSGRLAKERVLYLHNIDGMGVEAELKHDYPPSEGWIWNGDSGTGSARNGNSAIAYTSLAMAMGQDAPADCSFVVFDFQELNWREQLWERLTHWGRIPTSP